MIDSTPPRLVFDGTPSRLEFDTEAAKAYMESLADGDLDDPTHPSVRLAEAVRHLTRLLVTHSITADQADSIADVLESSIAGIPTRAGSRYTASNRADRLGPGGLRPNGDGNHPFIGRANPVAPPLHMSSDGACVRAEVTYDERHEGLPGLVQGGVLAAGFDIVLGRTAHLTGRGGPTGTYSVRFVGPTPILQPLTMTAWPTALDGRKVLVAGELTLADGTVTVTATGTLIMPSDGRLPTSGREVPDVDR